MTHFKRLHDFKVKAQNKTLDKNKKSNLFNKNKSHSKYQEEIKQNNISTFMNQNFNNKRMNSLLLKEYQRHIDNNFCFNCDKLEHMSKNCHFKSKNKPT